MHRVSEQIRKNNKRRTKGAALVAVLGWGGSFAQFARLVSIKNNFFDNSY